MDFSAIEKRLESGESLKIKYRFPLAPESSRTGTGYAVRTDKLVDVSKELQRFYTKFRGEMAIWLQAEEVIDVLPDDGVYEDFPNG